MSQEISERVSALETTVAVTGSDIGHIRTDISDIKGYLMKSAEQRVTMLEKQAVMINKQDDFINYQARCDKEREELAGRVDNVESFQRGQKRMAGGIAACVTLLAYGGSKAIENFGLILQRIGGLFS